MLISRPILAVAYCATVILSSAFAGTPDHKIIETPAAASPWEFRVEPYGWGTVLDGTTGVKGFTTDIDIGLEEVLDHLDMVAALQLEVRKGRWGVLADGFYAELSGGGNPPGPFYANTDFEMKQGLVELALAFRVYENPRVVIDVYAGMRYNYLSMDLSAEVDNAGVQKASENASERIVDRVTARARALAQQRAAEFRAAAAAARTTIETSVRNTITADATGTAAHDLERELAKIRRLVPNEAVRLDIGRTVRRLEEQQVALAEATAEAEITQLKAAVGAATVADVARARARVSKAEKRLASSLDRELQERLPVSASAEKNWIDPIIGLRAQWNITDRWFLAAKGDIGGFGVSSDFVWQAQGTVGFNFTKHLFTEVGYRYLHTDYTDGGFTYDVAQSGFFMGLGLKF
jgi:hypothetical protein